jgi:hypothetical protein
MKVPLWAILLGVAESSFKFSDELMFLVFGTCSISNIRY